MYSDAFYFEKPSKMWPLMCGSQYNVSVTDEIRISDKIKGSYITGGLKIWGCNISVVAPLIMQVLPVKHFAISDQVV